MRDFLVIRSGRFMLSNGANSQKGAQGDSLIQVSINVPKSGD